MNSPIILFNLLALFIVGVLIFESALLIRKTGQNFNSRQNLFLLILFLFSFLSLLALTGNLLKNYGLEFYTFVCILAMIAYFFASLKVVGEDELAILERGGRYLRRLRPGVNMTVPILDKVIVETAREKFLEIEVEALTRDNVTLKIQFVIFYKIVDLAVAMYRVEDLSKAIKFLLTSVVLSRISEIDLEGISNLSRWSSSLILSEINSEVSAWGVQIARFEIQKFSISESLRNTLERERSSLTLKRNGILETEGIIESFKLISAAIKEEPETAEKILSFLLERLYIDKGQFPKKVFEDGHNSFKSKVKDLEIRILDDLQSRISQIETGYKAITGSPDKEIRQSQYNQLQLFDSEAKFKELDSYIDSTILDSLRSISNVYDNYLSGRDYEKVVETANSAYEMCQTIINSLDAEKNKEIYRKLVALASYWKLNGELYKSLID